jgi:hypothetical protein
MAKKKKDGAGSSSISASNSATTSFGIFKAAAQVWKTSRDKALPIAKKVIELRNYATYVTGTQMGKSFGSAIQSSRISANVESELLGRLQQLEEAQQEMMESLHSMSCALDNSAPFEVNNNTESDCKESTKGSETANSWPIDRERAIELLDQMQQQTLLEVSIYELLLKEAREGSSAVSRIDQDASVTFVACFTYSPYVSDSALSIMVDLNES